MFSIRSTKSFVSISQKVFRGSRGFAAKPQRATWREWISHNRQGLLNIFGMALLLQYAIQNYELKSKWDEHENELIAADSELKRIKNIVNDDKWLEETTKKLKGWKATTLKDELIAKFTPPKEESMSEKVKKQQDAIDKALNSTNNTPSTVSPSPSTKSSNKDTQIF